MNQFQEAALDRQEDRELRRDMADPVFLPDKASLSKNLRYMDGPLIMTHPEWVMIAEPCTVNVSEHLGEFLATIKGNEPCKVYVYGWGSCAAASIREALKA